LTLDLDKRTEEAGDERTLWGRDPTDRKPSARGYAPNKLGCESDDRCPPDVRHDDVERAVNLAERNEHGLHSLFHPVDLCIAPSCLDGCCLDIERHHPRSPEPERAQPEHATATANIEDSLAAFDPLQQLLDEQSRRGMLAAAETPSTELDQPGQISAIVLGPREADAQPLSEGDGLGVPHPGIQLGAALGPSHRQRALSAKSHRDVLCLPLVIHDCQHQAAGIAGRLDPHHICAKLAETGPHDRDLLVAGRDHDDHDSTMWLTSVTTPSCNCKTAAVWCGAKRRCIADPGLM